MRKATKPKQKAKQTKREGYQAMQACPHCKKRLMPKPAEILALRKSRGQTQRQMAATLGVKASHIAYLETGQRKPSGSLVLRMMKVSKSFLR